MVKLRLKLAHAMMSRSWFYHIHGRSRRHPPTASDSENDDSSSTNRPIMSHHHDNPMYTETSAGSSMPTSDGESPSPSPSPLSPATQNPAAFRLDVQELNRKLGALSSDERQTSIRQRRLRLSDDSPPSTDDGSGSTSNSGRVRHPPEDFEEGVLESGGFSGTPAATAVVGKFVGTMPAVGDLAGTNIKPTSIGQLAVKNALSDTKPFVGDPDGTVHRVGCSAGLRQYCRQEKAQRRRTAAGPIRRNTDGLTPTPNYGIFKMAQFADKYVVGAAAMTESPSAAAENANSSSSAEKWLKEESIDDLHRRKDLDSGKKLSVYGKSSARLRACQAGQPSLKPSAQIPLSVKPTKTHNVTSSEKPSRSMWIPNPLVPKKTYKQHKCSSKKDVHHQQEYVHPTLTHRTIEKSSPPNKNPHHGSCFSNNGHAKIPDLIVHESIAMVKNSFDPLFDFKESMLEMILSYDLQKMADLVELLQCYLALNSDHYHHTIVKAFYEVVWCGTSAYQS